MAQIDKNTVSAENQLSEFVFINEVQNEEKRILFVGNSITKHGRKLDIGWDADWGMAASSPDKDYVHMVMNNLSEKGVTASYCICQVAEWERQYKNGEDVLYMYEKAREFNADTIIMRCIENCPSNDLDKEIFKREYEKLIEFFDPNNNAEIILTTSFWKHSGDDVILEIGKEKGYKCIYLGDLGERDEMKAIGLFEHGGVAAHPGDLGMKTIADMITEQLIL